jgi:hypothetical protein
VVIGQPVGVAILSPANWSKAAKIMIGETGD